VKNKKQDQYKEKKSKKEDISNEKLRSKISHPSRNQKQQFKN
jgi:hypothetical protein